MHRLLFALSIAAAGCDSRPVDGAATPTAAVRADAGVPSDAAPAPETRSTRRDGTRVAEMRALAADVAADKVCGSLRNRFHRLKSTRLKGLAIGVLWVEGCHASASGAQLSLSVSGRGWRWIHAEKEEAAADFEVNDYARFSFTMEARADIDVAYASGNHVLTAWGDLVGEPAISVKPLGKIDVDADGVWAEIVGGSSSLVGDSPEDKATDTFASRAREQAHKQLRQGITLSINLCTGDVDTEIGQHRAGKMLTPASQERGRALERGRVFEHGLILVGPVQIRSGTKLDVTVAGTGQARVALLCEEDAITLARAFTDGKGIPVVKVVASQVIAGRGTVVARRPRCRRAAIAIQGVSPQPVEVEYRISGIRSPNKPYLHCSK